MQKFCVQEKNYLKPFEYDETMHGIEYAACRKIRLWSMIQQMNTHYNRVRMLNLAYDYDWSRIIDQHKLIVRGVQEQDESLGSTQLMFI